MRLFFIFILFFLNSIIMAQEKNYFYEIKEFEENYSSRSVVSRFVHSVGFRYYWATEGLRDEDLNYKPSESGISTRETLEHIYNLSIMIKNGSKNAEFKMSKSYSNLSFDELRKNTLNNLKESISIIENFSNEDFENSKVIRGKEPYDFYNLFHGPISDSLYHIGQVVAFRRASGNPIPRGVNHFLGIYMGNPNN